LEFLPTRHDLNSLRDILRMPEPAAKEAEIASLVEDLEVAVEYAIARRPL
jgi:hypothetical protein